MLRSGWGERKRAPWPSGAPGWSPSLGWGWYVPAGFVVLDVDRPADLDRRLLATVDRSAFIGPTRRGVHLVLRADWPPGWPRSVGQRWGEAFGPGAWLHGHGYCTGPGWVPTLDGDPLRKVPGLVALLQPPPPPRVQAPTPPASRPPPSADEWRCASGSVVVVRNVSAWLSGLAARLQVVERRTSRHQAAYAYALAAEECRNNGQAGAAAAFDAQGQALCLEARGPRDGAREWRAQQSGAAAAWRAEWG